MGLISQQKSYKAKWYEEYRKPILEEFQDFKEVFGENSTGVIGLSELGKPQITAVQLDGDIMFLQLAADSQDVKLGTVVKLEELHYVKLVRNKYSAAMQECWKVSFKG